MICFVAFACACGNDGEKDATMTPGQGVDSQDSETKESPGHPDRSETTPTPPEQPIDLAFKLHVGSISDEAKFMEIFGNLIKEKFPYVTPVFKTESLKALIEANEKIDILYDAIGQTHQFLIEYDMQFDITDLIKKYNYNLSALEQTSVEVGQLVANGGLYGLPVSVDSVTMLYNRGLFDKFGLDYPSDELTWEDLYEITRNMSRTENDVRYYGLGFSPYHVMSMDPSAPAFIDSQTNQSLFSSEPFRRAFSTLAHFYTIGNNVRDESTWAYGTNLAMFSEQRLAVLLGPSALGIRYFADKDPTLDWDLAAYPRYKEAPDTGPQLSPGYFYISSQSEHKDVAFQVSAYVTSAEFQKHLARNGYSPILQQDEVLQEYGKNFAYLEGKNLRATFPSNPANIFPLTRFQPLTAAALDEAFKNVVLGIKDMNTALRDADESINRKIEEELAKIKE